MLALQKLGIKPAQAFYIGDWPEKDIAGSKKVGLVTAFARWGEHPNAKKTGADYDLKSIDQVVKVVRKINNYIDRQ